MNIIVIGGEKGSRQIALALAEHGKITALPLPIVDLGAVNAFPIEDVKRLSHSTVLFGNALIEDMKQLSHSYELSGNALRELANYRPERTAAYLIATCSYRRAKALNVVRRCKSRRIFTSSP